MTDLYSLALNATTGLTVAELHGTVVGLSMTEAAPAEVIGVVMSTYPEAIADLETAEAFAAASAVELEDAEYAFHPLLPDDDEEMAYRLLGLADWVSGFLFGVQAALEAGTEGTREVADDPGAGDWESSEASELPESSDLPPEYFEALRDLTEISRVDTDGDGSATEEEDYMQLVEYVRAGVLLMKATLDENRA